MKKGAHTAQPVNEALEEPALSPVAMGVVASAVLVAVIVALWLLGRWNRRRPRECETCKGPRRRLGEDAEDEHLTPEELSEERVGSVNYDVWWCSRCRDALVLRYGGLMSGYSKCPSCQAQTKAAKATRLVEPTQLRTGLERIDEHCEHCDWTNSFERKVARQRYVDKSRPLF